MGRRCGGARGRVAPEGQAARARDRDQEEISVGLELQGSVLRSEEVAFEPLAVERLQDVGASADRKQESGQERDLSHP